MNSTRHEEQHGGAAHMCIDELAQSLVCDGRDVLDRPQHAVHKSRHIPLGPRRGALTPLLLTGALHNLVVHSKGVPTEWTEGTADAH